MLSRHGRKASPSSRSGGRHDNTNLHTAPRPPADVCRTRHALPQMRLQLAWAADRRTRGTSHLWDQIPLHAGPVRAGIQRAGGPGPPSVAHRPRDAHPVIASSHPPEKNSAGRRTIGLIISMVYVRTPGRDSARAAALRSRAKQAISDSCYTSSETCNTAPHFVTGGRRPQTGVRGQKLTD